MKKNISDSIEKYLKVLIARSEDHKIEIQRAELAETFGCVPSQVTYVINTRFTAKGGYYTESRRGGRGYVRITEFKQEGEALSRCCPLCQFIDELGEKKLLNPRETAMLKHIALNVCKEMPPVLMTRTSEEFTTALRQFLEINQP